MAVELAGFLYNNAGTAIQGATVDAFDRNTTTPNRGTTTTSATGYWTLSIATEGRYDARITSGSSIRWLKYDSSAQMQELETNVLKIRDSDDSHTYEFVPSNITANRTITIPLLAGNDILPLVGFAQTWTALQTFSRAALPVQIVETTDGASQQVVIIEGDRATPADNDAAYVSLRLSDSAGNQDEQVRITWVATTVLNGATQDADLVISVLVNNVLTEMLRLDGSVPQLDFNSRDLINMVLITPTIAATGWANANHDHAAANSGGQAAAGNLSGATLAAGVTASSLVSLGNLTSDLIVANNTGVIIGNSAQVTFGTGTAELQVLGTGDADTQISIGRWTASAAGGQLAFLKSRNATIGSFTIVSDGDSLGDISWFADDGVDYGGRSAYIFVAIDGVPGSNDMPGRMIFATTADGANDPTERLRITSAGVLTTLAATPTAVTAARVAIFGGGMAFTDVANAWIDDATQGTGTVTHYIGNNTINVTAPSDIRLKRNIGPLEGLSVLKQISVIEFESDRWAPGRWGGFDAEQARSVLPNLTFQDSEGFYRFQNHMLMPYVVGSVQELEQRIARLEKASGGIV